MYSPKAYPISTKCITCVLHFYTLSANLTGPSELPINALMCYLPLSPLSCHSQTLVLSLHLYLTTLFVSLSSCMFLVKKENLDYQVVVPSSTYSILHQTRVHLLSYLNISLLFHHLSNDNLYLHLNSGS